MLDNLVARGLKTPEFLVIDGAAGLEKALAALWPEVPTQRCTVHKHRNLLAHAPDALHEEISADYTDMIYAQTAKEIETRRKSFIRKWRLKCRAVADSLEEAGERLFTFTRLPESHMWTAPSSQGVLQCFDQIACVHMSGLLVRSHMNAGQDGFRDKSSKQSSDLMEAIGFLGVSRVVDRLITPSAHYLASSGIGSARLQLSCSPCLADL